MHPHIHNTPNQNVAEARLFTSIYWFSNSLSLEVNVIFFLRKHQMFPPAIYFMFMIFFSLTCYSKSIYENKLCLEKCLIETFHSCSTQILGSTSVCWFLPPTHGVLVISMYGISFHVSFILPLQKENKVGRYLWYMSAQAFIYSFIEYSSGLSRGDRKTLRLVDSEDCTI